MYAAVVHRGGTSNGILANPRDARRCEARSSALVFSPAAGAGGGGVG